MKWTRFNEQDPAVGSKILITDDGGNGIALGEYNGRCGRDNSPWIAGCGFSGYEWDFDFLPTRWALFIWSKPE